MMNQPEGFACLTLVLDTQHTSVNQLCTGVGCPWEHKHMLDTTFEAQKIKIAKTSMGRDRLRAQQKSDLGMFRQHPTQWGNAGLSRAVAVVSE